MNNPNRQPLCRTSHIFLMSGSGNSFVAPLQRSVPSSLATRELLLTTKAPCAAWLSLGVDVSGELVVRSK